MLLRERSRQVDELLGLTVAALDIPAPIRAAAVAEYEAVAAWLRNSWPAVTGEIYPQGSIRLGTMVTPITDGCDYDIDLVCRFSLTKAISKRRLKSLVGTALRAYVATRPPGAIKLKEGKRCWTLIYVGRHFHMDVLPAIPHESHQPDGIWLTDRSLTEWQPSNPIGYAEWFSEAMATAKRMLLEAAAADRGIDVEQVPPDTIKTPLQQTVQALKRHRDLHFNGQPELVPASIILTTLAARAYSGGTSVFDTLVEITELMPQLVERRGDHYVVANPVLEDENFADRWRHHPGQAQAFFDWIEHAHSAFASLGSDLNQGPGMDRLVEGLRTSLGQTPAEEGRRRYADRWHSRQRTGRLTTAATGVLGATPALLPNPRHTFHGGPPNHT